MLTNSLNLEKLWGAEFAFTLGTSKQRRSHVAGENRGGFQIPRKFKCLQTCNPAILQISRGGRGNRGPISRELTSVVDPLSLLHSVGLVGILPSRRHLHSRLFIMFFGVIHLNSFSRQKCWMWVVVVVVSRYSWETTRPTLAARMGETVLFFRRRVNEWVSEWVKPSKASHEIREFMEWVDKFPLDILLQGNLRES